MTAYFSFAANIIIAGHAVTLVVDSRITTYEVFIPVKVNLLTEVLNKTFVDNRKIAQRAGAEKDLDYQNSRGDCKQRIF